MVTAANMVLCRLMFSTFQVARYFNFYVGLCFAVVVTAVFDSVAHFCQLSSASCEIRTRTFGIRSPVPYPLDQEGSTDDFYVGGSSHQQKRTALLAIPLGYIRACVPKGYVCFSQPSTCARRHLKCEEAIGAGPVVSLLRAER
jgi:hypothetical protein